MIADGDMITDGDMTADREMAAHDEIAGEDWRIGNQRAIAAAIGRVRARLEAARAGTATPADEEPAPGFGFAVDHLCRVLGLTGFERDVLLTCAGAELEGDFPAVPSFGLALAALAGPHWSALLPLAPLRWWRLVSLGAGATLTSAPLRIEEPVLHFLAGMPCRDERLAQLLRPLAAAGTLPPSQAAMAGRAAAAFGTGTPVQLVGPPGEIDAIAAAAARHLGLPLLAGSAASLEAAGGENWLRLWQRDAALSPAALLIQFTGREPPEERRAIAAALRREALPVLLGTPRPLDLPELPAWPIPVARPTPDEQAVLWRAALHAPAGRDPDAAPETERAIGRVVGQFDLGAVEIAAAARAAGHKASGLWQACRALSAVACDHVRVVPPTARWRDLALPAAQEAGLRELVAQILQRRTVHDTWGFGRARGFGVAALFCGPSGTGKSLAAEIVAAALGVDLHVVDLSRLVSKYIGETEQHLRAAFDAAEACGAVLLFDEADALFGARSDVQDSHDRYANMQVSYLLQRIEHASGLAILTTNFRDAIDGAFLRRLRCVIEFAHPLPAERQRLWQTVLPDAAPREALDPARLAQANFTGAQIRNVALAAAFLAADAGEPIRMVHLEHAARRECAKLRRPLTAAEVAGW